MVSTYTTRNQLEKPALGDFKNTWGDEVNVNWDIVDLALDGSVSKSTGAVLTDSNGAVDEASARIINFTGTGGGTITIPAIEKWYIVRHTGASGSFVTISAGGVSVRVPRGMSAIVYCDGTDCFINSMKQLWQLLQTQATTSGTSKSFSVSGLTLDYYTELVLEFAGVSYDGTADLRISTDNGATWGVLGNFDAADVIYGAARIIGHTYNSPTTAGVGGIITGAVEALATAQDTGTGGGFSIAFSGGFGTTMQIDANGATFDAGAVNLWGR